MKITLHGASGGEVTGSAYHVQSDKAQVLVDFGMFQGVPKAEDKNRVPAKLPVNKLQAVLLTHAHLDHVGRLPLLAKRGYEGPVFCTPATAEMAALILRDAAKIQAQDNERLNRKRERAGLEAAEPLFTAADVDALLARIRTVPYAQPVDVAPGMQARFLEAGHMLGSSSIQLCVEEGRRKRVVFSGDLGPKGAPILRDAEPFEEGDVVFLESTYGDHDHKPFTDTVTEFFDIVGKAVAAKGKILVPTFAVGRAQMLMLLLDWAFRSKRLPEFPVCLDSPMAIEATRIYGRHKELFDDEMIAFMKERPVEADFAKVRITASADESKSLNELEGPCMILAGAGMCNAGRILHHLRQNLWKPGTTVIIVGYQSHGSLGRLLVEGAKEVSIFGERVAVRAGVHTLGGFSAHAGQTDLLDWFGHMAKSRPRVVLTHGESTARTALAAHIQERFGLQAELPALGDTVEF